MKYILILCLTFFMLDKIVLTQKYYVLSVMGKTWTADGKTLLPKQEISDTNNIKISEKSRIVLLDEKNRVMYVIRGAADGNVLALINRNSTLRKVISEQYMMALLKKSSQKEIGNSYMQSSATTFRDLDSLITKNINDSIKSRHLRK